MALPPGPFLLVTVGSTSFDNLVRAALHPDLLSLLPPAGIHHVVVQYGKGQAPTLDPSAPVSLAAVDFVPSLSPFLHAAAIVVTHAGTTVLEALACGAGVCAVVNPSLMDNHQTDIAHALQPHGLVYAPHPDALLPTFAAALPALLSPSRPPFALRWDAPGFARAVRQLL